MAIFIRNRLPRTAMKTTEKAYSNILNHLRLFSCISEYFCSPYNLSGVSCVLGIIFIFTLLANRKCLNKEILKKQLKRIPWKFMIQLLWYCMRWQIQWYHFIWGL